MANDDTLVFLLSSLDDHDFPPSQAIGRSGFDLTREVQVREKPGDDPLPLPGLTSGESPYFYCILLLFQR